MVCPECHGRGGFLLYEPGLFNFVCSTCGGSGVTHCCEGEQAHPDTPSEPQPQSATAAPPTCPPDPTS